MLQVVQALTEYSIFSQFLCFSDLCHQGDAIKAKVRSCHINSPSETKKDVGDDCNSFKLFKQFVIILGCDFLFKCRYIKKKKNLNAALENNGMSLVLLDNQSCFVLTELLFFVMEAYSFVAHQSRNAGLNKQKSMM